MTRLLSFAFALTFVVLTLSSFTFVLAQPPYPCTYTNANEVKYDLTSMWRNPGTGQEDFKFSGTSDGSVYWVNVCGQAAETACNPPNGVCQIAMDGSGYGDGDASTAKWQNLDNNANGVKITITNGSGGPCNGVPRTSYLQISCDTNAGDGVIDSVTESQSVKCQYTIVMRSKWACGQSSGGPPPPPPPPDGPPPPPPPPKPKSPLSIGSIILITVACIIPVYLVVGALIKWKVYEAEPLSVDIIPNVGFWSALPFLVKDGCVYFVQKVSGGRVCGEYGQI